ncbi:YihA family ribosome biogenesis GTP-binding protein [Sulfitobacter pseudonitzschiae]|uniref:Probable GTP-binding protein EngB n=1 Tax=Pseudosulfitobacter pseudonitzschiae TaxID=1402135 RepID=A0A9Q2P4F4_9RHOB|nr:MULTISPECIES: ribosome biogenesis GTP-binding protein YihA/YsxC [Roseobacteraceae]MBM2294217.1 YihA family ribosome biogenesis GTP-binding protein [Pseudosulfitobacter pseudonitzschiae]MBM2299141.1 YihA family ribosome biogenesis GTP-binding protein [Pseudosulfitobacter pseudonitzschiae]MBM2304049.1 YihA family ribosome biogenesis GTP-binding protein [Pseudosulfitobacter pseudonitzschiae]MBM2313830.1 YihA family ribosome biogenesis GTP-binding protein [Pseudosulfitobacter pseudonitzschiae]M
MQVNFKLAEEPDAQTAEKGRLLFAGETVFVKGVVAMSGLPDPDRMEVCFAGRSNVGKSSLINALTGTKALARASNTPGRTQEINFFTAGDELYLVDLPGYGYANAPLQVVEKWQRLLKQYLGGRQTLRRAFVLVDARHGIKKVDDEIMSLLDSSAVTFQVILTKADKVKEAERTAIIEQVRGALAKHPAAYPEIVVTSSEKGWGIPTLRALISTLE